MPVPQQRDPELSQARLGQWCAQHIADGAPTRIGRIDIPTARGFANETLLFEAEWSGPAGPRRERLVARIAAPGYRVYPEPRLAEQYQVLAALGRSSNVPVPPVFGYEPDPDLLGGPFFVMGHVPGRVPADLPSYHRTGWVAELSGMDRERLWWNGLDALLRVHVLDPATLGLAQVGYAGSGADDLTRHLDHYVANLDFFRAGNSPIALRAIDWLRAHRPAQPGPSGLLWGDARLGNLVFDGLAVAAVLDWEMVAIGPAEIDLAWYLYLDRHLSEGIGATRLSGLPSRTHTACRYAELLGRPLHDLDYYQVFAGFRFALITARVADLVTQQGMVPAGTDFPLHRNAVKLLARTIDAAETGRQRCRFHQR